MESVIELENVTKRFKGFSVENMDLQVRKGFINGFIGANGAGKSTTIKLMMNLLRPDEGQVRVFGLDYKTHEKEIKERIGFVYDGNVFYEGMNLKDIQRIVGPAYKRWDQSAFNRFTDQFELPLNKPVKTFSKGMQMKASLALALSHQAELIIMDEPTAGLDPIFRRELLDLLQEIMLDGERTIFFSTHITTDLDRIADYIAFIKNGKLIFNETIHEVTENYGLVKGNLELLDRDTERLFIHVNRTSAGFEGLTANISEMRKQFGGSAVIESASLEDIMYYSKGREAYAESN